MIEADKSPLMLITEGDIMPEQEEIGTYAQGPSAGGQDLYDDMPMSYNLPAGEMMGESISAYFGNFFKYSLLAALAVLPLAVWGFFLFRNVDMYDISGFKSLGYQITAIGILSSFLQSIAVGAIIYGVFKKKSSQSASFFQCLGVALSKLHRLIGVTIVILIASVLIYLPFLLGAFIPILGILIIIGGLIPILMFLTASYLAPAVVVVESKGIFESLKRSFDLTRGNRSKIFAILLVFGVVNKVIDYVISTVLGGGASPTMESILDQAEMSMWVNLVITVFFAALGAVAVALVYHRIRSKLEGLNDLELAALFD